VLNEDNDPIRDDSWFAGETAAAMRDFARTVIIGDPPKDVLARAKANKIGRDAVFERTLAAAARLAAGETRL